MTDILTVTKEDAIKALEEIDIGDFARIYDEMPGFLRDEFKAEFIERAKNAGVSDQLKYLLKYDLGLDFALDAIRSLKICGSIDDYEVAMDYVREYQVPGDKRKLLTALLEDIEEQDVNGFADSMVRLLEFEGLTPDEVNRINECIKFNLEVGSDEVEMTDIAYRVMVSEKVQPETREYAVNYCSDRGEFRALTKAAGNELLADMDWEKILMRSLEVLEGELEDEGYYPDDVRQLTLADWEVLPKSVKVKAREMMDTVLQNIGPDRQYTLEEAKQDLDDSSGYARSILETFIRERDDTIPEPQKRALETLRSYIEQRKDVGTAEKRRIVGPERKVDDPKKIKQR